MTSRYSLDDYAAAAAALLPRGRAWSEDPNSVQRLALRALAGAFQRVDSAAVDLLKDAFPATAVNLLPEWEETVGLPDPCAGPSPTIQQRQDQVAARFIGGGGQSATFYEMFAAALGFDIEIVTYAPFRVGQNRMGFPLGSTQWAFTWGIRVTANRNGLPTDVLLCELNSIKPAQTSIRLLS